MYDEPNHPVNNDNSSDTSKNEPYRWHKPALEESAYHNAGTGQKETVSAPAQNTEPSYRASACQTQSHAPRASSQEETSGQNGYQARPVYERDRSHFTYADGPSGRPPKKGLSTGKVIAIALICALLGGIVSAPLGLLISNTVMSNNTSVQVSDRVVSEVEIKKVDGMTQMTHAENYAANVNSVVSINVGTQTNYWGQIVERASSGSGFILTEDGYILTNYHVVEGASRIDVTTYSGKTFSATYIGGEEDYDIAVIKIQAEALPAVTIGDSSKINVGDDVIAIGNPLGELTFSLTSGSVSSADRAITLDGVPFNMIQVDCAINPGNSGGPLFNDHGEVIGIVSAKYSSYANTTVEGLGFAIPINDVFALVEDIMENGYVTNRAYLGIYGTTVTKQMQMQYNLPSVGLYIYSIEKNGPAEQSGMQPGDIIVKVGDTPITSMEDLISAKKAYRAGDTATMTVNRNGTEVTLEFTFGAEPAQEVQTSTDNSNVPQNGGNYGYSQEDIYNYFFGMNPFG